MKYLSTLMLLGIVVAGCASRTSSKRLSPNNPDIANVAPEGRPTEAAPGETASSLPAMTANPTVILLTPVQGNTPAPATTTSISTENWRTFTSTALGVTVNYPPDWSAAEGEGGATFIAPNGATIQLKKGSSPANTNEFRIGNQYCTARTNEHGQAADICVDNASFTYTAQFTIQKADGSTQVVILMTKTRTVGNVYEAMINSLQPAS